MGSGSWHLNQYTAVAGSTLSYSANGNLSSHNGWNYTYDAQNRLESAHQGATQISFAYDGFNRCVKRTVNGVPTYLCYAGWNLIEERSGNGNVLATYLHGANTDEILTKSDANGTVYYHQDALGNVTHLTDSSGNVVEQYRYDAYGHPTIFDSQGVLLTTSAMGNRFLFTGREWLEGAHLYDYRNRIYSAELGRFLQTDPIRFDAGDVNLYRYVFNDPINLWDPYGLKTCWRRVHMTHYGDLSSDKVGTKDNSLKPGDIAVGHHGEKQHPQKGDAWSLPFGTSVGVYPDNSSSFPGTVADVGAYDKKHPDQAGPDDWIDIWDPEKSRKNQSDDGWISFDVDDCKDCPSGAGQYPEGAPGQSPYGPGAAAV